MKLGACNLDSQALVTQQSVLRISESSLGSFDEM